MTTSLLTHREAAERLRVSLSTARRLGTAGQLDRVRISPGAVRIREESVRRLLEHGYPAQDPRRPELLGTSGHSAAPTTPAQDPGDPR